MIEKRIRPAGAERRLIAPGQQKVLAALIASADPNAPPSEDDILSLILGEMSFMRAASSASLA